MNSVNNTVPPVFLPWTKEWAASVEAGLQWAVQEWMTRCNSPLPMFYPFKEPPLLPVVPPPPTDKPPE